MARDRGFAAKQPCRPLDLVVVVEEIVVHKVALACVATPNPSVPLDAVYEKLSCGELQCVDADLPHLVDLRVVASERPFLLLRHIFIVYADIANIGVAASPNLYVSEGFAVAHAVCFASCPLFIRGEVRDQAVLHCEVV